MAPLVFEGKDNAPILIVDRSGEIGEMLADKISNDTQVVLVSKKAPTNEKIIFVPFEKRFPVIPHSVYSHIFIVDDLDPIINELLPSFSKKASEDKASLVYILNAKKKEHVSEEVFEYKGVKVIYIGDVVDKNIYKSFVAKFINRAKLLGKMEIPGEGLETFHPVFFEDVIEGILEAAFGTSRDKIYYLFQENPISILSFAHMIKKANPNIMIDFRSGEDIEKLNVPLGGRYLLDKKYPVEDKLKKINFEITPISREKMIHSSPEEKNDHKSLRAIIFFLLLFLLLPLISTLVFAFLGGIFINAGKTGVKAFDFELSGKYISTSHFFFGLSKKTSDLLLSQTAGASFAQSLKDYSQENYQYAQGFSDLFKSLEHYNKGELGEASSYFKSFILFSQRQKTKGKNVDFIPEELFSLASATLNVWPDAIGLSSPKKYLLILQNNLTVRPSGGLVQAYAVLSLDKGKLTKIDIGDPVYLKNSASGKVDSPFIVRRFLKKQEFVLEDVSFSPDFRKTAEDASYIFSLQSGQNPDGVISINLNYLKKILELTGPVDLKGKKIDQRSLLQFAQENSDDSVVMTELLKETFTTWKSKDLRIETLLKSISQDLKNKNVLVAFSDKEIQDAITVSGFSGSLWDEREDSQKLIMDTLGISEASLGNSSLKIERKVTHVIDLKENINAISTIVLNNTGESSHRTYLRFIVPIGSALTEIIIDGDKKNFVPAIQNPSIYESRSFKDPSGVEVLTENLTKTVFGIYVEVPARADKQIEISYSLGKSILDSPNFKYSFLFIKQPGVDFYPLDINISFPKEFRVISFPQGVSGGEGTVSVSKNIKEDYKLELDFSKK